MDHAAFIFSAYAFAAFVIAALIGWIARDHRSLTRMLADYERRGLARGSGRNPQ
jgi:heme exporter protein CcmD